MNFKDFLSEGTDVTISVGLHRLSVVDKDYIDTYNKMYKVKLGKYDKSTKNVPEKFTDPIGNKPVGSQTVTGTPKNIIKFLTGEEPLAFDLSKVKYIYPELF